MNTLKEDPLDLNLVPETPTDAATMILQLHQILSEGAVVFSRDYWNQKVNGEEGVDWTPGSTNLFSARPARRLPILDPVLKYPDLNEVAVGCRSDFEGYVMKGYTLTVMDNGYLQIRRTGLGFDPGSVYFLDQNGTLSQMGYKIEDAGVTFDARGNMNYGSPKRVLNPQDIQIVADVDEKLKKLIAELQGYAKKFADEKA